ncbi:MAG: hypothetical protein C4318_07995 [Acidimicrobiia bacterium]
MLALIEPFRGIRYNLEKVGSLSDVCAPPYDVIDEAEKRRLLETSPYNSVRLILPEDEDGEDRFSVAARTLSEWMRQGILLIDEQPSVYPYRMKYVHPSRGPQVTAGLVVSVSLDRRYRIVPHERTMAKPLEEQMRLLASTKANLSPVYLLVVPAQEYSGVVTKVALEDWPLLGECTEPSGVEHCIYKIDEGDILQELQSSMEEAVLVIADGHHRFEVARSFWEATREPGSDRIMALVVDLDQAAHGLQGTHRIIVGSADDPEELLKRFKAACGGSEEILPDPTSLYSLLDKGRVILLTRHNASSPKHPLVSAHCSIFTASSASNEISSTPSAWVHDSVLNTVPQDAVVFESSLETAFAAVIEGKAVAAILLPPPSLKVVTAVARAGSLLPQKSTYFYPKPRTGAVFRRFDAG